MITVDIAPAEHRVDHTPLNVICKDWNTLTPL